MRVDQQVKWIVDWYWRQEKNGAASLDAHNFDLEKEFIEATGVELKHNIWRKRVCGAATFIGLKGCRHYNADSNASAGIPLFTMVYS